MADRDSFIQLRNRVAEQQQRMERAAGKFREAIDALRMRTVLYETPADVDIVQVEAAVADLRAARLDWIDAHDRAEKLKGSLGL